MNTSLRCMLCLWISMTLFPTLSAQTVLPEWYDLSFAEFHQRYAFSPEDHQLIEIFQSHHQKAHDSNRIGGGIAGGGVGLILADAEETDESTGMGFVITGLGMIGLGGVIALLGETNKIGYTKRSLYLYLHGERRIPRYIQEQLPDEDESTWYGGRHQPRI